MFLDVHLFHDLLRPCTTFSKVLHDQDLSVVDAIEAVMKTTRNMEQLQSTSLDVFPTVKKVMSQVRSASDGMTYQRTRTLHYDEGIAFLTSRKDEFFGLVSVCLKNCVKSHHSELLKDILTLLSYSRVGKTRLLTLQMPHYMHLSEIDLLFH